jgi:CheY-like chemotaxis protein
MYSRGSAATNLTRFRHLGRPVLLVDHDREFGSLMRVAFESRGQRLDWTDRISDARRLLACDAYDPVIIDLRLYDGSGLDLLADAANNGLLAPECAVIVASHDFLESQDSLPPKTSLDLDAFLDCLVALAPTRRPLRDAGGPRIQFVLYILGAARISARESNAGAFPKLRFFLRDLSDHEWMVA